MSVTFELNRANWDERAAIHARDATNFYRLDDLRAGGRSLGPVIEAELGDVAGVDVLHLQCHIGTDSIMLARRGARVTGLDFSGKAIETARQLAAECGADCSFVEGNVYDARTLVAGHFDLVYATWGVVGWIPDMVRWIAVAASMLKPGGRVYLADMHPTAAQLTLVDERLVFSYPWRSAPETPSVETTPLTYTGDPTPLANATTHQFDHPISELIGGVLAAGLELVFLHEHDVLYWPHLPDLMEPVASPEGDAEVWRLKAGGPQFPLAFSIAARLPA